MTWHIQYRRDGAKQLDRHTPERAIEAACRLMDDGCDVYGIGTGPLNDSIERDQIARIYDLGKGEAALWPLRRTKNA